MSKFKKYEKYKNTEFNYVGDIPLNWDVEKVKQILQERNKKNNPVISKERLSLSIDKGVTLYSEKTTNLDRFKEDFTQYKLAYINDLVLNSMNMIVGASGISKYFGCVSPAYYVLYSRDLTKYNPKYFAYFFKTQKLQSKLYSLGKGIMAIERGNGRINTCRLKVPRQDLKNLYFPVPPIEEQNRIVDFITYKNKQIDNIIKKQKSIIKLLEEKKNIAISKAITKGLDKDIPLKDSTLKWIGKIPEHWNVNALFQLFVQVKNKNIGLKEKNLLSLSYGKLKRKNIDTTEGLLPNSFEGYNIIKQGDIVLRLTDLQNDQKSLRVGHSDEKGIITSAYVTIRNRSSNLSKYLYYYLHSFDIAKGFYGMGAGVRQVLNFNELKYLNIILPPVKEQEKIVKFLDKTISNIDKIIEQKKSLIEKLEEYKKILISNAVTGQIDIRDYVIKNIVEENIIEDDIDEQLEDEELNEVEYANN